MSDLKTFFKPRSVAIIGASRTEGKIGHTLLQNLVGSGYKGAIYPVNPKHPDIMGLQAYPALRDIDGPVDLAVVSIPAAAAVDAVRGCGECGVKNLVVITAGFKEVGREGLAREKVLVDLCKKYGMRALGPNCLGMMDTHTPLNVSFAARQPLKGDIGFVSQSGALCVAILDWSVEKGIGFSKFISLGNKAVLNEADFIAEAANDGKTRVILVYLEDVGSGRQFLGALREATRRVPVIIYKAGTSEAGARAASSHTGALAGSDRAYDAALRQGGALRAKTMDDLFVLAVAFATQPTPPGDRVAIITNSGGPGIIATDAVEARKLRVARFEKSTIEALRGRLPAECNIYNPVDLIASADADRYAFALETVLSDPNVDNVVVVLTPVTDEAPPQVAAIVPRVRAKFPEKPVVCTFIGGEAVSGPNRSLFAAKTPSYAFPEPAVSAIAGLVQYSDFKTRRARAGGITVEGIEKRRVEAAFDDARADGRVVLLGTETAEVAAAYGIAAAPSRLAREPDRAVQIAEEIGYPVVLKVASPRILHKTDIGGVKVGLQTASEVEAAFTNILESAHKYFPQLVIHGIEVQKMMPPGIELIVGMTRDVQFGPLLAFGLGGVYVNLLQDVSFRLSDGLAREDIAEMIAETKAHVLLHGFRGRPPADVAAVADTIARLARLVDDFPEVSEMEINPLLAYEKGVAALDVKITIS